MKKLSCVIGQYKRHSQGERERKREATWCVGMNEGHFILITTLELICKPETSLRSHTCYNPHEECKTNLPKSPNTGATTLTPQSINSCLHVSLWMSKIVMRHGWFPWKIWVICDLQSLTGLGFYSRTTTQWPYLSFHVGTAENRDFQEITSCYTKYCVWCHLPIWNYAMLWLCSAHLLQAFYLSSSTKVELGNSR